MNLFRQQADPRRHLVGIGFVVLLHALVVWALVAGMAKRVVEVVRSPVETRLIEEVRRPLPPPEIVLPPPPKMEAPPPPFIPPPEVRIAAPPPAPTIVATTPILPPAPLVMAPLAPPVVAAPAPPPPSAPPRPALASIGVVCPTMVAPAMPPRALREGISGSVRARATIQGGKVVHVEIVSAQPRGVFEAAVRTAMLQYTCLTSGSGEIQAEQTFDFKIGE